MDISFCPSEKNLSQAFFWFLQPRCVHAPCNFSSHIGLALCWRLEVSNLSCGIKIFTQTGIGLTACHNALWEKPQLCYEFGCFIFIFFGFGTKSGMLELWYEQMQVLAVSLSYLIYDLACCQLDERVNLDNTVHHLVSIVGIGAGLSHQKVIKHLNHFSKVCYILFL